MRVENKSVPELRFGEFEEPLRSCSFSEIGSFYYGKSAPKSTISDDGKTLCVRYGELYSTYNGVVEMVKSKTTMSPEELKMSKGGEVLIPRVGEDPLDFSLASYLPFRNVAIGEMISVFNTEQNGLFITLYIRGKLKKTFAQKVEGASVSNLYFRYLEPIKINLPSLPEQQKIADFLTAVDSKIQALTHKLDLPKEYKKGLMQKLFDARWVEVDGEMRFQPPTIRFKDDNGEEFVDWEEKKLGQLGRFTGGGTPSTQVSEYWQGNFPWISSSDLEDGNIHSVSISKYITEEAISLSATRKVPANSLLLVTRVGVGKFAITKEAIYTSQDFTSLTLDEDSVLFLGFLLQNNPNHLQRLSQGTSIKGITLDDLKIMKLLMPDKKEQTQIADFLILIDDRINMQEQKLDHMREWKKGLLQKMFV